MFETLLARLARALDAADLSYMVIGGQAVLGVLLRQPEADLEYVGRWLSEFDVALGLNTVSALDHLLNDIA